GTVNIDGEQANQWLHCSYFISLGLSTGCSDPELVRVGLTAKLAASNTITTPRSRTGLTSKMAKITYLECSKCGERVSAEQPQTVCPRDAGSLYVRYDLEAIKKNFTRESLLKRPATMWRYAEVLPDAEAVTLGEGFTPMLR